MAITDHLLPALMFFNEEEARISKLLQGASYQGNAHNPGAKEAEAVIFIDRALAGYFSHLQIFYREGIAALDRSSRSRFGCVFLNLSESEQDELLRTIEGGLEQRSIEGAYETTGRGSYHNSLRLFMNTP